MNIDAAIHEFLLACDADGFTLATLRWYRSLLARFAESYSGPVNEVTTHQLREYLVNLRKLDYSKDTISAHTRALHRFFAWASNEYTMSNPMCPIKYPRAPQPQPRAASMEDIQAMFQVAENTRDRAILAFLLDTGCRAGGLCKLRPIDLDIREKRALVTEKGDKTRAVIFTEFTAQYLWDWITERYSVETLFYNLETLQPLTPSGLYQLLRRLARRAKVQGRFNPHSLRHTFAREYIIAGGDLATLSRLLGHRDVSTTVNHYAIFTDREIREKHEKYSPVKKLRKVE